ncbi:ABC transporter ATP-binding protein [Rubrivirga litoralis]|uniref:ABC transporter ATP-binding protein n=1 Tax=Rubrivirga litoralis TaxID=3075598 RepID=A0ABU3BRS5_9BACT|nr:ABC transporter ATP-binding protein [Rubrivirga sp. F394]MDT0631993.1 ABC transporter ATP-binding protein [Rubrivirga sp. F394]
MATRNGTARKTAKRKGSSRGPAEDLSFRERLGALSNLPPLFRLVWATSPGLVTANLALRLVRSLVPVAMLYVGKLVVDEVVRVAATAADLGGLSAWGGALEGLAWLLAAELGLAVLSDVLGRATALCDSLLGDLFTNETSVRLMRHAAALDLAHFENADFYDQLERARRQTTGRMVLLSQVFGQAESLITVASLGVGLAVYQPWLLVLLAVALVPAFLGEAHFNAQSYSLAYSWTPERRELDYLRYVGASDDTAKEVKVFGLNDYLAERYRTLADRYYLANRSLAVRRAGWGGLLSAVGTLGYYAAYAVIVYRTAAGAFTIGDLTFLAGSFGRMRSLLEGLLASFSDVSGRALYLEDLFSFFEIEPAVATPPNAVPVPDPIAEGFAFEGVGFRYPGSEVWAVRDLTFTLRAGEALALVGENGAGKTTLVKLLARLYDPDEGRILLDGRDLRDYDLDELRSAIGVIFQDFVRYHLTASENIAVGRIAERGDRPRIETSAERSLADAVIESLPEGYDQTLGKRFSAGVDLSGGQWQKVALGRAYMRDAQLLILDEPTAALDARAEYEVFERFKDLTEGKTAVLISHRFSTVRMADRILVLDGGRVEEVGTHEELLRAGRRYAELFELQAQGYR